jgi:choline dehydrogenase-like flavoprotein
VPDAISTEILVVGSGPGGAVTAALCAEAGRDVLLLEEGSDLPLDSAPHFSREEILQKYRNAGVNVAFGNAKMVYVEGRCVGGGSEINRGLYHRLPDDVCEAWRSEFKVDGLSERDLAPHFDACEQTARVQFLPGKAPEISLRLQRGAASLGWESIEAPRLFVYADAWETGAPGRKQSMSETFVPRFRAAGGRLMADACAKRIMRIGGKWRVRVRCTPASRASRELEVTAETVFVACGAIQTPALLRRSGITRNVGDSLRFHPMLKAVALFADEVNHPGELEPVHQIKHFDPRFSIGCSMSKRPALAMAMAHDPDQLDEVDRAWRRMAIYYVQNTGGRGKVRTPYGFDDAFVRVNQSRADLDELAEGLRRLAEVLFAAGAIAVYPSLPEYPALRSPTDIAKMPASLPPARASTTALHLFSSCPMGENMACCATDSFGRVHGMDGLHIADASLLCGPTVVNPQGSVMAIAHRNARHFLEARGTLH